MVLGVVSGGVELGVAGKTKIPTVTFALLVISFDEKVDGACCGGVGWGGVL